MTEKLDNDNNKSNKKLAPCPFCNRSETRLHDWLFGARVICGYCKCQGPEYSSAKRAILLWNHRPKIGDTPLTIVRQQR